MGATHTTLASSTEDATRVWLETLDYTIDERLYPGSGRMMRTFRLSHKTTGSLVVAKSMWTTQEDVDTIKAQQAELERIKEALKGQPHVAPFFFWNLGSIIQQQQLQVRPIALVRNHVYTTLSDRLESRPFLTNVEKLYIIHQLLSALQAMHDAEVLHGFLTTENVCLTSWNYVVIVDIASYKSRTALPDDDPSEYLYYFQEFHKQQDTNTQREKRCYLAPERFYSPKSSTKAEEATKLTPSMDVFSAGCIVLETWLNGERALDLGDLMDYRNQQSFPPSLQQKFQKIESSSLRAACRHMLHLDPSQRLSPAEYLERLQDIIPSTFSESLEPLMERFTNDVFTPDARMALAAAYYNKILKATVGVEDDSGKKYFCNLLGPTLCRLEQLIDEDEKEGVLHDDAIDADNLLQETEALLKKLETLDFDDGTADSSAMKDDTSGASGDKKNTTKSTTSPDSLLIFVQLILANLRHVTRPSSKLVALQLLARLGKYSSDETRLQRIVPSTIFLLQDQDPLVRALALKVMTTTLSQIQSFPPSDSKIFPQYVFKRVAHLLTDPSLVVRIAFSECIPVLAETSQRFLDISHAVRLYEAVGGGGSSNITDKIKVSPSSGELGVFDDDIVKLLDGSSKEREEGKDGGPNQSAAMKDTGALHTLIANTYDAEVSALHEVVSRWVVHITTSEQSSSPKKALLSDLARLCNFFGRDGVMAFVLPQILAFLNDRRDWQLRAALFDDLPSACFIIGRAATEHFVLPCLETALVDSEDQVLRNALMCLTTLVDLGLLSRSVLVDTRSIGLKESKK
jgi:phosphoinositide-3-kinase regulatory subunit 4